MSYSQFTDYQVTKLLRENKVEISMAINKMFPFLHDLRDKQIITFEKFKEIEAIAKQKDTNKAVYQLLSWLEVDNPRTLHKFWDFLFKDYNLQKYPKLLPLQETLSKGVTKDQQKDTSLDHFLRKSVKRNSPDKEPTASRTKSKQIKNLNIEAKDKNHDEKKQKTFHQKLRKPNAFTSSELPVKCGSKNGILHKEKLAKGSHMKSIQVGKQYYSPTDFETLGGLRRNKKWKTSIKCNGFTLQKCIQMGYLSCQRKSKMSRHKPGSPKNKEIESNESSCSSTCSEFSSEDDVRLANQAALNHEDVSPEETFKITKTESDLFLSKKLPVSCGSLNGILHKHRFISGVHGKCIRTETKWCTPMEFEDLSDINKDLKYWKRNIRSKSETLGKLIQKGYLKLHKSHCDCEHCTPQFADQHEDNDDVCTVCKKGGHLICCDECPRTFHEQCLVSRFKQSEKWSCTFCKIRNLAEDKSGNEISNNDLFMQPMSPNQLMKCELALLQLLCNKESVCFKKDPCKTIPDYSSEIDKPMWLHKVKENLMAKNYLTVDTFRRDVHLIFQNCIKFNQGNQFEKIGRNLSQRFEENLRQIFSIS